MNFQLHALAAEQFRHLSSRTDDELAALGVRRMVVDATPGFPCRVSLSDGQVGEVVYLLHYVHHDVASPYRSAGPIFVREGATTARPEPNEIPLMFRHRLLSVRGYDEAAFMVAADVVQGQDLEDSIRCLLEDPKVAYLHVHNAQPGCFNCRVDRV